MSFEQFLPPELQKQMQAESERFRMSQEEFVNSVDSLFKELGQDHLYTLHRLFAVMASSTKGEGARYISTLEGRTFAYLEMRFNVCPGCNKNHEEEAMKKMEAETQGTSPKFDYPPASHPPVREGQPVDKFGPELPTISLQVDTPIQPPAPPMLSKISSDPVAQATGVFMQDELPLAPWEPSAPNEAFSLETLARLEKYDLDDAWVEVDGGKPVFKGWQCRNCGLVYVSIEDRELREPGVEGCSGCQQKAMWG